MKTLKYIFGICAVAMGLASCVGDLDVKPIDPAKNTADKALQTEDDYFSLMAQCYAGFSISGSYGPNGDNNISGIDGGFSQYFRGLYHLNGLTTDEAVCGWNDQTIQDLHGLGWTTSDVFVAAFYYRVFYQISACNEFLRQVDKASISLPDAEIWKAEVRTLRAICWYHAIDNYGNVPFADETASVGADLPRRITRAELFTWLENELKDIIDNSALYEIASSPYGRINKGAAVMLLAKLYLNAEVYTGRAMYQECADILKMLDGKYSLHDSYEELFMADNNRCTDELIFTFENDGTNTQSYGSTNYLVFACTGGDMDTEYIGISSGWGGLRMTPEFYQRFSSGDARRLFFTETEQAEVWTKNYDKEVDAGTFAGSYEDYINGKNVQQMDIETISEFTHGYAYMKYRNVNHDGSAASAASFVDVDYPLFRYADALLMKAECAKRGASVDGALSAYNDVRRRAGLSQVSDYTLDDILDERARELYLEGWRRSDLIRFGKFTSGSYLWQWKGGVKGGRGVADHMSLFPIPDSDLNSNPNLVQNPGY